MLISAVQHLWAVRKGGLHYRAGRRAALKSGAASCTEGRATGLQKRAGRRVANKCVPAGCRRGRDVPYQADCGKNYHFSPALPDWIFWSQNQKFGSLQKHLALECLFGYLATFWLFCNLFVPQIFLGKESRVAHVACSRHDKTIRSGPPDSCAMR